MRAIIDGVLYDTDDMERLGSTGDDGQDPFQNGFRGFWEETLYLAEGPAFVLAGQGGPDSKYAAQRGDGEWIDGKLMTILSVTGAREWCEENLTVDQCLEVAEKVGWTVRRPGEEVREVDGRGRLRVTGTSSLVISVTREAKALGLGRGDEVEYTIRKIPAEREAERWRAGESGSSAAASAAGSRRGSSARSRRPGRRRRGSRP